MLKLFSILILCAAGSLDANILYPNVNIEQNLDLPQTADNGNFGDHIKDFLELIDTEAVMSVVFEHLGDQEVLTFLGFLLSEKFGEFILEFQSMAEFKEATNYLTSKGYDVISLINFINSLYELPPYEANHIVRNRRGISNMIEKVIEVLPLDKMKELFEYKLENNKEVADLFNTLTSEEFLYILKRMKANPTFQKSKETFESFGFDFKYLCSIAKEIFGEYYLGIFCDSQ